MKLSNLDVLPEEDLAKIISNISSSISSQMKSNAPFIHTEQFGVLNTCKSIRIFVLICLQ